MTTLLMIEDDPLLGEGLELNLKLEGHQVVWAKSLAEGDELKAKSQIDLILLDLNLPDGSGLDYLKKVRESDTAIPIIILSAQSEEETVIQGLNLGANDYVRKPFKSGELFARIKSAIRRSSPVLDEISIGKLKLSNTERKVFVEEKEITINRREFDILEYMIRRKNHVLTREMIITDLHFDMDVLDRTIDSHISHLRSKLKKANVTEIQIKSEYGIGYRLVVA